MTTLTAEGASGSGTLTVDDTTVKIMRTRSQAAKPQPGNEKRIPLMSIEVVRWREATTLTNGYIQFALADATEHRRSFFKAKDENVVLFGRKHQPEFEMIRAHVEARLGWTPTAGPSANTMEQLTRLVELHHRGFLTVGEFAAQKADLVSRVGLEALPTGRAVPVPVAPLLSPAAPSPSAMEQGLAAELDLADALAQSDRLRQVLRAMSGKMGTEDEMPSGSGEAGGSRSHQDAVQERLARAGLWFRP